jgi:hypothetical protein
MKNEYKNERDEEREKFTVLVFKASARYFTASAPKPVLLRSSVMSVCVKKRNVEMKRMKQKKQVHCIIS